MQVMQPDDRCKLCQFETDASGASWWANLQSVHVVFKILLKLQTQFLGPLAMFNQYLLILSSSICFIHFHSFDPQPKDKLFHVLRCNSLQFGFSIQAFQTEIDRQI